MLSIVGADTGESVVSAKIPASVTSEAPPASWLKYVVGLGFASGLEAAAAAELRPSEWPEDDGSVGDVRLPEGFEVEEERFDLRQPPPTGTLRRIPPLVQ